jgi:hypothetical protein
LKLSLFSPRKWHFSSFAHWLASTQQKIGNQKTRGNARIIHRGSDASFKGLGLALTVIRGRTIVRATLTY